MSLVMVDDYDFESTDCIVYNDKEIIMEHVTLMTARMYVHGWSQDMYKKGWRCPIVIATKGGFTESAWYAEPPIPMLGTTLMMPGTKKKIYVGIRRS